MKHKRSHAGRIEKKLKKFDSLKSTGEILWCVKSDDKTIGVTYGDQHKPFFIASATKLYVTAILSQLRSERVIDWDLPIHYYLPEIDLSNLSRWRDVDHGNHITIREIMAHKAGLPDYFEGKTPNGSPTIERAIDSDFAWKLEYVLKQTKAMKAVKRGSSLYSDTGYQLLGALIQQVDGVSFSDSLKKRICDPLGLSSTYVFNDSCLHKYSEVAVMLNGKSPLRIPLAMSSVQADGGVVSTVQEASLFLDAFFSGEIFPNFMFKEIASDWHRIFQPLDYGTGIMRIALPSFMTGFKKLPDFIGHSGASGTVMFRSPELGLTVVGTVNQIRKRSLPFKLMIQCGLIAMKS